MSRLNVISRAGLGFLVSAFMLFGMVAPASALPSCTNGGQPSTNDIVYCGAFSKTELQSKIDNGDGVNSSANLKAIFFDQGRGITMDEIMDSSTVDGTVFKDGSVVINQDVVINGKVVVKAGTKVADNAQSVGRTFVSGSTKSGSVWMRSTQTSFLQNSITAFVNMDGGTFHFFVLKPCGNIGIAHNLVKPIVVVKASPKPTKPTPCPSPSMTMTPTPTETETPSPAPTSTEMSPSPTPSGEVLGTSTNTLAQTGPEDALGGAAGLMAIGYAGRAYLRSRRNFLDSFKNKIDKK